MIVLNGRKATKLEVEFGRKLCDAQDENVNLRKRIQQLEAENKELKETIINLKKYI